MPFYNREHELHFLNGKYRASETQRIVIYGKRRVCKTELAKQFFQNKPHLYYLADKLLEANQLSDLAHNLGEQFILHIRPRTLFANSHGHVLALARGNKELEYLARSFLRHITEFDFELRVV